MIPKECKRPAHEHLRRKEYLSITAQSVRFSEQNLFVSRYLPRNKTSSLSPLCLGGKNRFLDKYDTEYEK